MVWEVFEKTPEAPTVVGALLVACDYGVPLAAGLFALIVQVDL